MGGGGFSYKEGGGWILLLKIPGEGVGRVFTGNLEGGGTYFSGPFHREKRPLFDENFKVIFVRNIGL